MVPDTLKELVMYHAHDTPLSGHMGFEKTLNRVRPHYTWEGMFRDLKNYCASCNSCAERRKPRATAKVQSMPPVERPFQRIALDILGPWPATDQGNKVVAVFTDYLTKNVEAFALPDYTAETIAGP